MGWVQTQPTKRIHSHRRTRWRFGLPEPGLVALPAKTVPGKMRGSVTSSHVARPVSDDRESCHGTSRHVSHADSRCLAAHPIGGAQGGPAPGARPLDALLRALHSDPPVAHAGLRDRHQRAAHPDDGARPGAHAGKPRAAPRVLQHGGFPDRRRGLHRRRAEPRHRRGPGADRHHDSRGLLPAAAGRPAGTGPDPGRWVGVQRGRRGGQRRQCARLAGVAGAGLEGPSAPRRCPAPRAVQSGYPLPQFLHPGPDGRPQPDDGRHAHGHRRGAGKRAGHARTALHDSRAPASSSWASCRPIWCWSSSSSASSPF